MLCPVCRVNNYPGDAPACPSCMARGAARTPPAPAHTPPDRWSSPYPPPPGYAPGYAPGYGAPAPAPTPMPPPGWQPAMPPPHGTPPPARPVGPPQSDTVPEGSRVGPSGTEVVKTPVPSPDEEGTVLSGRLRVPTPQPPPRPPTPAPGAAPPPIPTPHPSYGAVPTPGSIPAPGPVPPPPVPAYSSLPPQARAPSGTHILAESSPAPAPAAAPSADPLIGKTPLGQYLIEKKLGEGGFGAVYLARQLGVDRKAVVKVLHKSLGATEAFVSRFHREAKAVGLLSDPHIVSVYNFGAMEDGTLFVAMEYGGDHTLADVLEKERRLAPPRALELASQIGQALREAHSHGIVHRDLKPSNIMLSRRMTGEEWVKVVDFGIAKIVHGSGDPGETPASALTQTGQVIGTPAYFSPEQARGMKVDARSDLYSLGVVLYQMLTGALPIKALTPIDYIRAHVVEPPTPPAEHGVGLPPRVERLLMKALEKDPEQRFGDAQQMLVEIEACERLAAGAETTAAPRRFPVKIAVGAGVGLVALGAAVVLLLRPGPRPSAPELEPARPDLAPSAAPVPAPPPAPPVPSPTASPAEAPAERADVPAERRAPAPPRPVKAATAPERRRAAEERGLVVKGVGAAVRVTGPGRFNAAGETVRVPVAGAATWNVHHASDAWVVTLDVRPDGPNLDITVTSNPIALMSVGGAPAKPREVTFTLRDEPLRVDFKSPVANEKWSLVFGR